MFEPECQQLCNNCQNLNCKWKWRLLYNRMKPESTIIKGFLIK